MTGVGSSQFTKKLDAHFRCARQVSRIKEYKALNFTHHFTKTGYRPGHRVGALPNARGGGRLYNPQRLLANSPDSLLTVRPESSRPRNVIRKAVLGRKFFNSRTRPPDSEAVALRHPVMPIADGFGGRRPWPGSLVRCSVPLSSLRR